MPFVEVGYSPLSQSEARIFYREWGEGPTVVFLHGGWGYGFYPVTADDVRVIAPDRSGYGQSSGPAVFGADFHGRAVAETVQFLDALKLEAPVLWGHSDGAVIAAMLAISAPRRCAGVVLEAFHLLRDKPHSRGFFERCATEPRPVPGATPELISEHARAWLDMASIGGDLYDGRLSEVSVPVLVLHGERDPRTEPGELVAVRAALPQAQFHVLPGAGHSPHSEPEFEAVCNVLVRDFATSLS